MRVYVVWETYRTSKWIKNIYLSQASAEQSIRGKVGDFHIEEYKVLG